MIITLDTSILIDLEKGRKQTIDGIQKLRLIYRDAPLLMFVPYLEFYLGILERQPKRFEKGYNFLQEMCFLRLTKRTAEIVAELKKKYDKKGFVLPVSNMLIAAQVKENNLLLVTKDKDFEQIDEIRKVIL